MSEPVVKLGPISHIGLVVEDAEKAAAFWTRTFGVGPFDIREYDMSNAPYFLVRGKPAKPTSLDPSAVGFERASGTLALAVVMHPDFDDTPLFDENADGNPDDDGNAWHVHWLVLIPDESCGRGALKVRDIPERARPPLPRTWPGPPVLIDSPGYAPRVRGNAIEVRVPFADLAALRGATFDGFTAELRMNAPGTVPLLCVATVLDSASGNLSLPGRIQ